MKHTVKKALASCLALLLSIPLASCALFGKPEAKSEAFDVVKDGAAAAVIVYPSENDGTWKSLANELTRVIKRATGVVLEIKTDAAERSGREILLGTTCRAESKAALAALGNAETAFSFSVSGDSLVIAAPNTNALSMAISYFEAQYDRALCGEKSDGALTFPADLSVTRTVTVPSTEPWQLVSSTAALRLSGSDLADIPKSGELSLVTGTAVVGNVLYGTLAGQGGEAKLIATDLTTGNRLAESEDLSLGEVGGMCYNPVLDLLVLTHCSTGISLIDPATLTVCRTATAGTSVRGIAYDVKNACYFALKTDQTQIVTLNGNFSLAGEEPLTVVTPVLSADDVSLTDFCADSQNFYLLFSVRSEGKETGGLLAAQSRTDPKRRSYFELPSVVDPYTISVDGRSFCVVSGGDEAFAGKLTRFGFYTDDALREPSDLFNEINTATVDASFVSAKELFRVYPFIKTDYKRNTVMQGACTDGKYGYFFMEYQGGTDENGNSNYANSETHDTVIVKMDMATCQPVKISEPLKLGHSNDGCYNPHTGELIVAYNGNDKKLIKIIDPETLTVKEEKRLPVNIFSITYNSVTRQYVVGLSGGRDFAILDESFNLVVPRVSTDYSEYDRDVIYDYKLGSNLLTQGIDCDSKYVYFVLSGRASVDGKNVWINYLLAFDYEGKHIFTKVLPTASLEVENVFHIGKDIFVTCNGGSAPCYRISVSS